MKRVVQIGMAAAVCCVLAGCDSGSAEEAAAKAAAKEFAEKYDGMQGEMLNLRDQIRKIQNDLQGIRDESQGMALVMKAKSCSEKFDLLNTKMRNEIIEKYVQGGLQGLMGRIAEFEIVGLKAEEVWNASDLTKRSEDDAYQLLNYHKDNKDVYVLYTRKNETNHTAMIELQKTDGNWKVTKRLVDADWSAYFPKK